MKYIIRFSICYFFILHSQITLAQFTHADTLRGNNGQERSWWDVLYYDISIKPDIENNTIQGIVNILFKTNSNGDKTMQIDLQEPLVIDKINFENVKVNFKQTGTNTWSLYLKDIEPKEYMDRIDGGKGLTTKQQSISIYYHGKPRIAKNPPWDGGIIWARDKNNNPWISIACQGLGASVWYPCKDYQGDEPDNGAGLAITIPDSLVAVANGRLKSTKKNKDGTTTYSWAVVNPINNYNIIPYIGRYVNFNEVYKGEKGNLDMNYWVLDYNLDKAKKQFKDAPKMMKAFEYWFGPYPFYEDGYKLVDAPHLGMEHQSAIAYGNGYQNGYKNRGDLSKTGWGLKWDFIIVHESAHEWWGNNITSKDIADMWIHESFANYSETLFTEYYYGKKAGSEYVIGLRKKIENDIPIIGPYEVNKEGSGDMYYKGGNMLHTIRQVVNDDEKFRMILRGLNKTFYHQTVTSKQVEDYITKNSGKDLSKIFDQYLRTTMIPTLEYKIANGILSYRWANVVKGFKMPVKVTVTQLQYETKKTMFIYPTENFKELKPAYKLTVDDNFYINANKVN
ncbi:MAG: family peptidase [Chitinophagaceae bacterium]|nr:family peptidase [Chitinophagaceae bacterium]